MACIFEARIPGARTSGHLAKAALTAGLLLAVPAFAQTEPADLRDIRVGMPAAALRTEGYAGFSCAANPEVPLADWAGYQACPPDAAGQREVGFHYGDTKDGATKVAGQPMLLSLVVGPSGAVQAIHMRTDPSARLFQHKRAYIFGLQVMTRYGEDGWACNEGHPSASEEPVGGLFVREHCEKVIGTRRLVIDRELHRLPDAPLTAFTSASSFTVSLVKPDAS